MKLETKRWLLIETLTAGMLSIIALCAWLLIRAIGMFISQLQLG